MPSVATPVNGFGLDTVIPVAVNLDAETGNTLGWSNEFGQLEISSSVNRSGSYGFEGSGGNFRAYQRVDIAQSGITSQHLAQGAKFSFRAWQRALSWGNDSGRIGLRFLDANQMEISTFFTDWDYKNSVFVPKVLIESIPLNCAFVDILLEGQLRSGTDTNAHFDDLELRIGVLQ